jgi:hypothetical protein
MFEKPLYAQGYLHALTSQEEMLLKKVLTKSLNQSLTDQ